MVKCSESGPRLNAKFSKVLIPISHKVKKWPYGPAVLPADEEFLFWLYCETRDDLAALPLDETRKAVF